MTDLEEFVSWCEERDIFPVKVNENLEPVRRDTNDEYTDGAWTWDWAELLTVWEDDRRGPQPPGSVTPIRREPQP